MSAGKLVPRQIAKKFLAAVQPEGDGARVRRSIGTMNLRNFSPFLVLDHLVHTGNGFPDHPHRGQETITYVLKGLVDHEDFTGGKGTIGAGDLQFMTAGRGIAHAEMPRKDDQGNDPEIMQLWVDLPENLKSTEPRYRDLSHKEIPAVNPDDKVEVKVISGESYGVKSVQELAYTPVVFYDYNIKPGGRIQQEVPEDFNVFLYVLSGGIKINDETDIPQFHTVAFEPEGNSVNVSVDEGAKESARFILVGGKILDQNVVQHGPFVETSRDRIMNAFQDYQSASNGFERIRDWSSEIGKR